MLSAMFDFQAGITGALAIQRKLWPGKGEKGDVVTDVRSSWVSLMYPLLRSRITADSKIVRDEDGMTEQATTQDDTELRKSC